jgi:hypothetical protein
VFQAFALSRLIEHFMTSSSSDSSAEGWMWATMILSGSVANLFMHHIYYFFTWLYGMQYKNGAISQIYKKR